MSDDGTGGEVRWGVHGTLDVLGRLVTVYGKRQGAAVITEGGEICLGDRAVVSAGKSDCLVTASAYSPGMRYLQVRFEKGTGTGATQ
ncbi:MAG: hypothetical protein MJ014_01105 [Methanocorpusculum sp.]|nr:hypothetical protein [Methanocorpusculum sp.]